MAAFDSKLSQIVIRIVYDGAGTAGKTTNINALTDLFTPARRGDIFSPHSTHGHTLFFDYIQLEGGLIAGHRFRCELWSVPGQHVLAPRREYLLDRGDVAVIVVDSRPAGVEAAKVMLDSYYRSRNRLGPWLVIQANKQDCPGALPPNAVRDALGLPATTPVVGAEADKGKGVRETTVLAMRCAAILLQPTVIQDGPEAFGEDLPPPEEIFGRMKALHLTPLASPQQKSPDETQVMDSYIDALRPQEGDSMAPLPPEGGPAEVVTDTITEVALNPERELVPSASKASWWNASQHTADETPSPARETASRVVQLPAEEHADPCQPDDTAQRAKPAIPAVPAESSRSQVMLPPAAPRASRPPTTPHLVGYSRAKMPHGPSIATHAAPPPPAGPHALGKLGAEALRAPRLPPPPPAGAVLPKTAALPSNISGERPIAPTPSQAGAPSTTSLATARSTSSPGTLSPGSSSPATSSPEPVFPVLGSPRLQVWPTMSGRSTLEQVPFDRTTPQSPSAIGESDVGREGQPVLMYRAGQWLLRTTASSYFPQHRDGYSVLVQMARHRTLLGAHLPPSTVLTLQTDPTGSWLWSISHHHPSLGSRIARAQATNDRRALGAALALHSEAILTAIQLASTQNIVLRLHPTHFAEQAGRIFYISDDIRTGQELQEVDTALLQPAIDFAAYPEAVDMYLTALEQLLMSYMPSHAATAQSMLAQLVTAAAPDESSQRARSRLVRALNQSLPARPTGSDKT